MRLDAQKMKKTLFFSKLALREAFEVTGHLGA